MQVIQKESREVVEPSREKIRLEENEANEIAQRAEAIKRECDVDLAQALPILRAAQDGLKTIKPENIAEIKKLANPPLLIRKVLHSICIMLDLKAEKTQDPKNPGVIEDNWWVTSQRMMGDRRFLQRLLDYDIQNINEKVLAKVRT